MDKKIIFDRFPDQGFIKTIQRPAIDPAQKAILNRKGNELFNKGDIEGAKRIFLTTGYSDGLSRVGDWYLEKGKSLEALQMYWIAPDTKKADILLRKLAFLIQKLIKEEDT